MQITKKNESQPMRMTISLASALALSSAGGAYANDWSGPYLGGNAGVAFLDGDVTITPLFGPTISRSLSDTGFTFGGTAGYNWQDNGFVFGIEGDFNYLDLRDNLAFPSGKATETLRADYDWFATVRGRAGATAGNSLFYLTGGAAFLDSSLRVNDTFNLVSGSANDVLFGFAVGAGIEHRFSPSWSGKVEYLYMGFEDQSVSAGGITARTEPEVHVLRAGVNFAFCTGGSC